MQHASQDIAIGIDVGATRTRVAAVDRVRGVLAIRRWRTPCGDSADGMLSRIARNITIVREEADVGAGAATPVAIALPGPLARDRRSIVRAVNLSVLEGRPIVSELARRIGSAFGEPTLYTDAEAATWGEYTSRGLCVGQAFQAGGPPLQRWGTRMGCRFASPTAKAMGHPPFLNSTFDRRCYAFEAIIPDTPRDCTTQRPRPTGKSVPQRLEAATSCMTPSLWVLRRICHGPSGLARADDRAG
ncbi:MAG: ROK family protein [Planctomycetes bacterium]|nr:ROK family protein [Planctomycetota bacterium]